jgi:hypothetical protein
VDRGMKAFFRRVRKGIKPGLPRFRSHARYNSLEYLAPGSYVRRATNSLSPSSVRFVSALGINVSSPNRSCCA